MTSRDEHVQRAVNAYKRYRALQEKIDEFELLVTKMYPNNDRMVSQFLERSEEPEAWAYRARCKLRAVQEQIISTETAMLKIYS